MAENTPRLSFTCDYEEGAHPAILKRLAETNFLKEPGYGYDEFSLAAKDKIREACGAPNAGVYFLIGGTQTNATVIDAVLRGYQGVVAANTGHVAVHEAGAIEFGGHKVLTVPQERGKVSAAVLNQSLLDIENDGSYEHMVHPGLVYISQPTEYGTLYTRNELERISAVCKEFAMPLFLDGARLGYGLTADTDVTLADIAKLTDVFYIGGTKCGALCGEAVVFTHGNMPRQFVTMVKRRGAMIAKGRLNALQFDALFTDGLYEKICAPAVKLAIKLRDGLKAKGYRFALESPTNQQFIIVENSRLPELQSKVVYSFIEKYDAEHTVIRLATSWATTEEQVDELLSIL
mgnify:CR=1 FL=1